MSCAEQQRLGLICGLWGVSVGGAEPTFPYEATIAVDKVDIRCGPGWDYYATQISRAAHGSRSIVTIREVGWRFVLRRAVSVGSPATPESHIRSRSLRSSFRRRGGLGRECPVRSGSTQMAGPSESRRTGGNTGGKSLSVGPGFATETFVKAAPPAGEFRWIHAEQADAPGKADGNARAASGPSSAAPQSQPTVRSVGGPSAVAAARDSEVGSSRSPSSPTSPAADLASKIEALQVELSLLVAQSIEDWDLNSLRQRVEALSQQNISDSLRRDAEAISRRISEFQILQQRHQKSLEPTEDEDREIGRHGITVAPQLLPANSTSSRTGESDPDVAPASGETAIRRSPPKAG